MIFGLANPQRFMQLSRWLAPVLGLVAAGLLVVGLVQAFRVPEDYQQGDTVRIMFVHVPAAWTALMAYLALGLASLAVLIWRHPLADIAAATAAPLGATFTVLALATGALWGQPMWGTWWVWDARLTSVLVLLLFFVGTMVLRAAIDDETRAGRLAALLGLVGLINLPIVKFSVDWWSTLHQPASVLRAEGPAMGLVYLVPLLVMGLGYSLLFAALWLVAIRTGVRRRRILALSARRLGEA